MKIIPALLILSLLSCSTSQNQRGASIFQEISKLTSIEGKPQYLASPFVTAGDRVYMVGFQDGSFPDLGWHITGEMGGVWDHPIKLLDGFSAYLKVQNKGEVFCLDKADKFVNHPMANRLHFTIQQENIEVDRSQFVPDGVEGLVVEFRIANHGSENKELNFSFTGMTDLRPTWLGERTNMIDAEDEMVYDTKLSAVVAKDKNNPWYTAFGSTLSASFSEEGASCLPLNRKGMGKHATLSYSLLVPAHGEITLPFFIAGSYASEEALRATYEVLKTQAKDKLAMKIDRYAKINAASHLTIPDKGIEQMYEWLKYNTDWLVRNVPEQGKSLSAGLPDYPWWFGGDATYALQGVLATGDHALAKSTILLLNKISKQTNDNGRIIHEVSTNGSVYNKGNVNETAQFVTLVKNYYQWTGDKELVKQLYPDLMKGMGWLLKEKDPDGNHYPNGSGMMEIPGLEAQLEMIDVAAYTQQALESAAALARVVGENEKAVEFQKAALALRLRINQEWWQPGEKSFGDFRGTVADAAPVVEAALIRSDTLGKTWAVEELKNNRKRMKQFPVNEIVPHVVYHNWVVNTPLETGVADAQKALLALQKARSYENPFGVFVTGIDRTEEADSVVLKSRRKIFSYTGAVMTLPTSVLAVSSGNYGDTEAALIYIQKLHQSFSYALPGSMYEVSPDFGMMTQAWNIYGVAVPIVQQFFGIDPHAAEKTISLSPHLPVSWKEASLDNVKVGDNAISISFSGKDDYADYYIQQTLPAWNVLLNIKGVRKILVNEKEIDPKSIADNLLILKGKDNRVRLYRSI